MSGEVSIHMVDPTDGRSLQKWSFRDPALASITIGRDEAATIQLADPYVSRIHVELVRDDEGWSLVARGRNGVYLNGRNVTEHRLCAGDRFRLSSVGPMFRFGADGASQVQQTLNVSPAVMELMMLNKAEVAQQANEISQTDYFQQLQAKARLLRRQRTDS